MRGEGVGKKTKSGGCYIGQEKKRDLSQRPMMIMLVIRSMNHV